MFRTADIAADGHPILLDRGIDEAPLIAFGQKTQVIETAADKGIHRVELGYPSFAEQLLGALDELLALGERRLARRLEGNIRRKQPRQVFFRNRMRLSLRIVDDGNGGAPVALAGDK